MSTKPWSDLEPVIEGKRGFHVTSYATAMLVSSLHRAVLENTTKCPVTLLLCYLLYYCIKFIPQYQITTKGQEY